MILSYYIYGDIVFEINQLVVLKKDVDKKIYRIKHINQSSVELIGYNFRSKIVIELEGIEPAPIGLIDEIKKKDIKLQNAIVKNKPRGNKYLFGRILHIDGDEDYLNSCLELYNKIGIKSQGIYMDEKEFPKNIEKYLLQITPDIIVITGHDNFNEKDKKDINNYEHSKIFGDTIRLIRKHFIDIVIIAGACKSHFEYLMGKGADFASSPGRINTHTFDPAIVAIKVATTSVNQTVEFRDIIKYIEGGAKAIGGIETKGKMKILY